MKNELDRQALIFVVDDDEDDLYFIKSALLENIPNCIVKCFIHGKQLMDEISSVRTLPTLILLDLNMPILNGKETLKLLRQHPATNSLPVVIISTSNNPNEKELCFKFGANNYFSKPSSLAIYDEIVQKLRVEYIDGVAAAG
ncbi:MAG: response regulator receiver protein [Bacteroidetes bacterium]|jgi:CheY-like chemotaxis protein|nr:response regulator receiver protein [Bacteroidota bacterium]